jgi:uncharacterized membrane protein
MAVRLEEVHPAIVHYPLALLPVAVGADLLGRVTGSDALATVGRTLMPIAATSAVVSAVTGLVAQEEVKADGEAADLLVTHRSLNLGLVTLSTALAVHRVRQKEQPGAGYFALALAGLGALAYSAYLGGRMVYEHGLGVRAADGLRDGDAHALPPSSARAVARRVGHDVERGIAHAVEDYRSGDVLPALGRHEHPADALPPADHRRV